MLLTPILVLPIAILFLLVGCTGGKIGDGQGEELIYIITFFFDNDNLGHTYEFRISDGAGDPVTSVAHTDQLTKLGGPADSIQGSHQFSNLAQPGMVSLTCEVIDLGILPDDDGIPPPLPSTAVAPGLACSAMIDNRESYLVEFNAGVLAGGTPVTQFEQCSVEVV